MKLWEHLLTADRKQDLTEPEAARKWLTAQPWGTEKELEGILLPWPANLRALRSVARRLKGKAAARPNRGDVPTDEEAELKALFFLQRLAPWPDPPEARLSAKTFRGLRLFPTYLARDRLDEHSRPVRIVAAKELADGFPNSEVFWWDGGSLFWQLAFLSLFDDTAGIAVCRTCGTVLGDRTPTGRPKRLQQCGNCRWQKHWSKQPKEKKQEKWRTDYKKRQSEQRKENN
jgi:hypothetical protein